MAKTLKRQSPVRKRHKKVEEPVVVGGVNSLPSYTGSVQVGDVVAYRWLGALVAGRVREIKTPERFMEEDGSVAADAPVLYMIGEKGEKTVYPIRKENILHKYTEKKILDKCKHWK